MKKIRLTVFQYHFTFTYLSILLGSVIFIFLGSLGIWQLHRADIKRQWLLTAQRYLQAKPLNLQQVQDQQQLINYHPLRLAGHYHPGHVILLDNKIYQHQVGYQILVPFMPEGTTRWIWINRGWVPRGKSRSHVPEVLLPKGRRILIGLIHMPEKRSFLLGENIEKLDPPYWRIQSLQIKILSQRLSQNFYAFELLLLSDQAGDKELGILDWKPSVSVEPARHIAYAIQWFGLAGAFLIIFFLVHIQRIENK